MSVLEKIVQWQLDTGSDVAPDSDMAAKHIGFVLEECGEAIDAVTHGVSIIKTDAFFWKARGSDGALYTSLEFEALADAFADMAIYAIAGLMRCGYDPIKTLEAVQKSNDSKRMPDGSFLRNEHGKIIKPAHYKAPDFSGAKIE